MGSAEQKPRKPWEQRAGEPGGAYLLFVRYRDLGEKRTVTRLAEQVDYGTSQLDRLKQHFAWAFRCDQWDAHVARVRQRAADQRVRRSARLEAEAVDALMMTAAIAARRALKSFRSAKDKDGKPVVLGVSTTQQLVQAAVTLSRLTRGEATERSETVAKDARKRLSERIEEMAQAFQSATKAREKDDEGVDDGR